MPSYTLIPRAETTLAPPRKAARRVTAPRRGVVIHCPGAVQEPDTLEGALELFRKIQGWHFRRKDKRGRPRPFSDIGYHFGVWRGHVLEGRDAAQLGAHAGAGRWPKSGRERPSFNASHFGIVILAGGEDDTSDATIATAIELADELVPGGEIVPHRSLTTKRCPGARATRSLRDRAPGRDPYVDARGRRNR